MIRFGPGSAEKASEAYEKGQYRVAYRHYRRLAKRGDGQAARLLGDMHRDGEGVKRDISTAMKWYSMAAGMGDHPARRIMGRLSNGGGGSPESDRMSAGPTEVVGLQATNGRTATTRETGSVPRRNGVGSNGADDVSPIGRPVGLLGRGLRLIRALASMADAPSVRSMEVRHELLSHKAPVAQDTSPAQPQPVEESVARELDPVVVETDDSVEGTVAEVNVETAPAVEESVGEDPVAPAAEDAGEAETVDTEIDEHGDEREVASPEDVQPADPVLAHSATEEELSHPASAEGEQEDDQSDGSVEEVIPVAADSDSSDAQTESPTVEVPREIRLDVAERDLLSQLDTDHLLGKADAGDVEAMLEVAAAYRVGLGVDKDLDTAASWYRRAATEGNGEAQFQLGRMYLKGTGVRRNRRHAFSWLRRAAIGGHPRAPFELGLQFAEKSRSIPDLINAVSWLTIAYEAGHLSALDMRETVATELSDDYLTEAGRVADGIRDEMQRAEDEVAAA